MMSLFNINILLILIGCCSQRLNCAPLELSEFDVEFVSSIVPSPSSSMAVVSATPLVLSNPAPSPTPDPIQKLPEKSLNMTLLCSYLYMYLVADAEKSTVYASGSPSSATVFTMDRYVVDTNDYYYKLRIQNTENFVYFTEEGTLGVGVPPNGAIDTFERHEKPLKQGSVEITLKATDSNCYLGFKPRGRGFCSHLKQLGGLFEYPYPPNFFG